MFFRSSMFLKKDRSQREQKNHCRESHMDFCVKEQRKLVLKFFFFLTTFYYSSLSDVLFPYPLTYNRHIFNQIIHPSRSGLFSISFTSIIQLLIFGNVILHFEELKNIQLYKSTKLMPYLRLPYHVLFPTVPFILLNLFSVTFFKKFSQQLLHK